MATQYEQLVEAVNVKGNGVKINHVPDATAGSRLFYQVDVSGFGTVFLSLDRRVTKVVLASGETIIKPKPDQRAEIFTQIAAAVKGNGKSTAEVAA